VYGLTAEESRYVSSVESFVDDVVRPVVRELEHSNTYPEVLIQQMKQMGVYGLVIPEPYGHFGLSTPAFALVTEALARGWMSLAGAFGGHSVVARLLVLFGTEAQRERYLPRMATGELLATMALTEAGGGSDLQALKTVAIRDSDGYVIDGSKLWIGHARHADLVALLCKTDPNAEPRHRGVSIMLVERVPGYQIIRDLPKLGYRGIESCELLFSNCRIPADALLGEVEGRGFPQMMRGLETGRVQVAARALGVGRAAYEDSLAYAQEREAFGVPIWNHQSIANYLADMVTKLTAARLLVLDAARSIDTGERSDLEAGMAKLFASEVAMEIAMNAVRICGSRGYSPEFDIERYFRDAPLMIVGEGTNEIQRQLITRAVVERGGTP
jgi:alkylation response protein AidB-like acyl-CoA dehydrogenase